jgi:hypothetical protein
MKINWIWFNFAALIVFLALVIHGAPLVPVAAGVAGAALLNLRRRKSRST